MYYFGYLFFVFSCGIKGAVRERECFFVFPIAYTVAPAAAETTSSLQIPSDLPKRANPIQSNPKSKSNSIQTQSNPNVNSNPTWFNPIQSIPNSILIQSKSNSNPTQLLITQLITIIKYQRGGFVVHVKTHPKVAAGIGLCWTPSTVSSTRG